MADPVTLGIIAATAAVGSAGMQTYSQHQQAKSNEKMAQYQADIAEQNRRTAHEQGVEEEHRLRREQRQVIGQQRAGLLESGVFGKSALESLKDSMINAELDVLNVRAGALRKGANFMQQADMARYRKKQYGQMARQVLVTGAFKTAQAGASGYSSGHSAGTAMQGGPANFPPHTVGG